MRHLARTFVGLGILLLLATVSYLADDNRGTANSFGGDRTRNLKFRSSRSILDAKNKTLGFQQIFVLSNPDRPDYLDDFISAAAASTLEADILDGVKGEEVDNDTLPSLEGLPGGRKARNEMVGTWRSHLNFVREVVHRRLSTALLVKDEEDWDVNLKLQLEVFAHGSQYVTQVAKDITPWSPYGDDWDLLWLGHCGAKAQVDDARRFLVENDPSVPAPRRRVNEYSETLDPAEEGYDDSARVVFRTEGARCPNTYAVSNRGARRILHTLSTSLTFTPYDIALSNLCRDEPRFKCLSIFPQLFEKRKRSQSGNTVRGNLTGMEQETSNLVFSTHSNMVRLLAGNKENFARRFPEDPKVSGPLQTRTLSRL